MGWLVAAALRRSAWAGVTELRQVDFSGKEARGGRVVVVRRVENRRRGGGRFGGDSLAGCPSVGRSDVRAELDP